MKRLLRNSPATLTHAWLDEEEEPVEAGTVAVTVRDGAGAVVASGEAANAESTTGIYTFALTATNTATLDIYEVTWVSDTKGTQVTHFKVVGGFYFTIQEARKFKYGSLTLLDRAQYPTQDIVEAREEVEQSLEDACEVAFVRQAHRASLSGAGFDSIWIPKRPLRKVLAVSVDGAAFTQVQLNALKVYTEGKILQSDGYFAEGDNNVAVHYEYGYDSPPSRIKRAALLLTLDRLIPSDVLGLRTLSVSDEYGSKVLAVAGGRRKFGIPEVDAAVEQYQERVPVIG